MIKVLIFGLFVVACHTFDYGTILDQWHKFQVQHKKAYNSPTEASKRFQIFAENLKDIEKHNLKYQNGEATYLQGVNQFTDMTADEFLEQSTCVTPPLSRFVDRHHNTTTLSVPESIDWRTKNVVTKPQDQGKCGACWAFSTTGAVESHVALRKGKLSGLSKQNLIDCISTEKTDGCEKGDASDAYEYMKKNGVEYEVEYPYTGEKGECHQTSFGAKVLAYVELDHDEVEIEKAVGNNGPVSTSVKVVDSLRKYQGGIYSDEACEGPATHSVLLVGYGSENGTPYWIVKNSWGADWGEQGYFRLKKGVQACSVHTQAFFPVV